VTVRIDPLDPPHRPKVKRGVVVEIPGPHAEWANVYLAMFHRISNEREAKGLTATAPVAQPLKSNGVDIPKLTEGHLGSVSRGLESPSGFSYRTSPPNGKRPTPTGPGPHAHTRSPLDRFQRSPPLFHALKPFPLPY